MKGFKETQSLGKPTSKLNGFIHTQLGFLLNIKFREIIYFCIS